MMLFIKAAVAMRLFKDEVEPRAPPSEVTSFKKQVKKDPEELTSVYGDAAYAKIQKKLENDLKQLRTEYQVPEEDPAGVRKPRPAKKKRSKTKA